MTRPLLSILFLASLVGCATGQPNAFERKAYYVGTNWVPEVQGQLVLSNNVITGTNWVTNLVARPVLEPREEVKAVLQTGGTVGTALGQVWIAPLMGLLWGAYTWYAEKRNVNQKRLNTTLGQNLETSLNVVGAQPGGASILTKLKSEIVSQQVETGVKKMAAEVHDNEVNPAAAKKSAEDVVRPANIPSSPSLPLP